MKWLTHPDNLEWLKKHLQMDDGLGSLMFCLEIITNRHLEKTKKTGKYILPDGKVVCRKDVKVREGRFVEWGNSDWEMKYLLAKGIIKEQKEPLFYEIKETLFAKMFQDIPFVMERNVI